MIGAAEQQGGKSIAGQIFGRPGGACGTGGPSFTRKAPRPRLALLAGHAACEEQSGEKG